MLTQRIVVALTLLIALGTFSGCGNGKVIAENDVASQGLRDAIVKHITAGQFGEASKVSAKTREQFQRFEKRFGTETMAGGKKVRDVVHDYRGAVRSALQDQLSALDTYASRRGNQAEDAKRLINHWGSDLMKKDWAAGNNRRKESRVAFAAAEKARKEAVAAEKRAKKVAKVRHSILVEGLGDNDFSNKIYALIVAKAGDLSVMKRDKDISAYASQALMRITVSHDYTYVTYGSNSRFSTSMGTRVPEECVVTITSSVNDPSLSIDDSKTFTAKKPGPNEVNEYRLMRLADEQFRSLRNTVLTKMKKDFEIKQLDDITRLAGERALAVAQADSDASAGAGAGSAGVQWIRLEEKARYSQPQRRTVNGIPVAQRVDSAGNPITRPSHGLSTGGAEVMVAIRDHLRKRAGTVLVLTEAEAATAAPGIEPLATLVLDAEIIVVDYGRDTGSSSIRSVSTALPTAVTCTLSLSENQQLPWGGPHRLSATYDTPESMDPGNIGSEARKAAKALGEDIVKKFDALLAAK